MIKKALQFSIPAGLAYGVMHFTDGMPLTRLLEKSTNSAFLSKHAATRTYFDFNCTESKHLRLSKLTYDEVNKELKYLYVPKKEIFGFPTVTHGGFTYGLCHSLAEHYADHFGLKPSFEYTYIRYLAPIFVEKPYIMDVKGKDSVVEIQIKDEDGKVYLKFNARCASKSSN